MFNREIAEGLWYAMTWRERTLWLENVMRVLEPGSAELREWLAFFRDMRDLTPGG